MTNPALNLEIMKPRDPWLIKFVDHKAMAFQASLSQSNPFSYDDEADMSARWGGPAAQNTTSGDALKNTMKKEAVIKDIVAAQEDLRALLARVQTVQAEVDKLSSGNATLQMYIDNLTKQIAKR
ncbi:unnamed protein product [Rhizoctonia solani]|uniref:Uncharacterized protein n=1 Tax=Rhizoctonia solani TaxID=456999 RepID=A0A8H3D9K2_9AGAM|nr:unnamed protein product [Rhizoctonia solani]CAE6510473.1 unnamed protein product [Rhizoctonia solani]